jgi:hypothetical protein
MASHHSQFILPKYKIEVKHKTKTVNQNEHGVDNPIFSNDDADGFDVDLGLFHAKEPDIDTLQVVFSKENSTVDINYRDDSIISAQPFAADDNEQASDEEVAANVSNKDDPSVSVLTFRSWFLGILFTCLLSFVNQFFWYRTSPLFVGTLVAQLLTYPLGKAMAKILPTRQVTIFRWTFTLNPGPFTTKEHCIITAMANATCVSFTLHTTKYNSY